MSYLAVMEHNRSLSAWKDEITRRQQLQEDNLTTAAISDIYVCAVEAEQCVSRPTIHRH